MISFSEVKQQIAELQALYACEMHRLTDKVSCAYWQLALADLDTILSSTEDESQRIDKLKEFLADQWQTIYNNSFCYTAYPNSDYTQLICAIAQKITAFINKENDGTDENRRPVGVVKILMPGIKTENLYQAGDNEWSTETSHLRPMWLKDQNRWQDIDIRIILNTHIVSQDGKSLIPLSVLEEVNSYVAHSELYKPYCYECGCYKNYSRQKNVAGSNRRLRLPELGAGEQGEC